MHNSLRDDAGAQILKGLGCKFPALLRERYGSGNSGCHAIKLGVFRNIALNYQDPIPDDAAREIALLSDAARTALSELEDADPVSAFVFTSSYGESPSSTEEIAQAGDITVDQVPAYLQYAQCQLAQIIFDLVGPMVNENVHTV